MIDSHCHIDLYANPSTIAFESGQARILTVLVTNSPSAYEMAYPRVQQFPNIRLALGCHPLEAISNRHHLSRFSQLVVTTQYVGEVGLDFSREGIVTKELQVENFRSVLRAVKRRRILPFMTVHSRRAEREVLSVLREERVSPAVFHWYTGPASLVPTILDEGHYLSINPAMIKSEKGQRLIKGLPIDRVLTESDGPFVSMGGRRAVPADVREVIKFLAAAHGRTIDDVDAVIAVNFKRAGGEQSSSPSTVRS